MTPNVDDTIAAIASAAGSALRGIIRISGNETAELLKSALDLEDHVARELDAATSPERLDCPVDLGDDLAVDLQVLYWPDKRSYTRQPAAELHCLGSPGLLQMLLDRLIRSGCRRAEPGEFTMRAFLAGRLDLAQAEAVMGLIDAKNRRQFQTAFAQLAGGIGGPVSEAREMLVSLLAELEAGLDFVEEDIEFVSREQLREKLAAAGAKIEAILSQIQKRRHDSDTVSIVLMGRPNVGKSSLFNKLTAGNAIVSDCRGTTRDYIKSEIEIDGQRLELFDTAGLETDEPLTSIGRMMAGQTGSAIDMADLRILCMESGVDPDQWEQSVLDNTEDPPIVVLTKCDLDYDPTIPPESGIQTSAVRALGICELKEEICRRIQCLISDENHASATVARTSESMIQAEKSIQLAHSAAVEGSSEELIAAEVRLALDHLGVVVGKIYTDDILDHIFSRFCIGK